MYSLGRFVKLALACNPNIIELLFADRKNQLDCDPRFVEILNLKESFLSKRAYHTYTGYAHAQIKKLRSGGTRNLGEKRKALREKHGYDTKNAMHCVRLLRQGIQVLRDGTLDVECPESLRYELLNIRNGAYALDELTQMTNALFEAAKDVRDHSCLPDDPDTKTIEAALIDVHQQFLTGRSRRKRE